MPDTSTLTKIISLRSDVNIESLKVGIEEAQQRLNKLGIAGATVTNVLKPTFSVMEKGGVILRQSSQVIETTAGNFKMVTKEIPPATAGMGDFEKALRRVMIVAPVWMAFRLILQSIFRLIADQTKFLIDLENAMARIRIVGKGTEDDYKRLQSSLIGLSLAYGTVASSALEAAKIFAQQGRSIDQTITLTRIAMIASQVLGTDMKTAVDDLTAAIESFNLPISDSISIINKWINVEKQFAVTSKDLADATKAAGATANQMGVTIDEFLGNVTAVIEVTRKSGSEAARGLQFIYARLLTTGASVLTQIARIPIYLDEQKKATFALTNTYRSATDVLDDLAATWDTLTNKERLSIAQNVASKRQLTIFMALMQNYNASLEARIASLASAGKAEEAFAIIQETVTIKLNRVATAWNNLTISIGDTSTFKGILDITAELINTWAAMINITQAYRNEAQKVKDANQKVTETQISQAKSLIELIELRDKYINLPTTETNIKMLERISAAMEEVKSRSKMTFALDSKKAIEDLNKFIDTLRKQIIQQEVDIDINIDETILKKRLQYLQKELETRYPINIPFWNPIDLYKKEIIETQNKLNNLEEDRNKKLSERTGLYETEKTQLEAQAALKKYDNEIETELTDNEREKFQIQSKLNALRQSGILTNQQMLDIEIEMVKNSIFSYDIHEKAVKLAELESQRSTSILSDLKTKLGYMSQILSIAGEEQSQIMLQEIHMKEMMYGEDYIRNNMEDRLKLAQALTSEMDAQEKKSGHLVDLYEIARKYGKETARQVSEYLGGMRKFTELGAGATAALRRTMPTEYKTGQAEEYFKGMAFKFPEMIEKERIAKRNLSVLNQIMIEPIQIKIDLDSEGITEEILRKIAPLLEAELTKKGSSLYNVFHNEVELH